MARTVDDRVVSLAFENSKFQRGVQDTLTSITKLNTALQNIGKGADFTQIDKAASKVSFSGITRAADGVRAKFGAMQVAGIAALSTLVARATTAGLQITKGLALGPISTGFSEYEAQLNAVQTILSNTKAAGTDLKDVNAALLELNHYADKTIYNFGQMTKNIGTFTAAGVDLDTATTSIKGIANLAALSGSNAEQASTAMYQLSQAISSGRVSLQDWNSVVNAGMGGSVFQRALAQTAVAMGTIDDSALSLEGKMKNVKIHGESFRESIMAAPGKQSWLTSDVLTNTLSQLSGDLTDAQLKAQGFNEEQIKAIRSQAKMAVDAATKVKTFTQLMDTTKEAIGSGWAQTWQIIFGDFGEAKSLFTGLSNAINGFVGASSKARNAVLKDWKELGGRTLLINTLKDVFTDLGRILSHIKEAFRDIFPAKTGKDLFELTKRFHDFMQFLKFSPRTLENIQDIFRGFFAVLDIGKEIIKGVWAGIKEIFKGLSSGSGGFLDFGASIGDMIVSFRDWLKEGDKIIKFFKVLGTVLSTPFRLISGFVGLLQGGANQAVSGFSNALGPASESANTLSKAWERVVKIFEKIKSVIQPVLHKVGETVSDIGRTLADAIKNADFDNVFAALQVALTGGIFLAIKSAFGKGIKIDIGQGLFANMSKTIGAFGGTLTSLSGAFRGLNGSLVALQNNIKANTLLQIAVAIGILSASLTVLSLIKPKKLDKAMSAVTVSLAELMGALALMGKTAGVGVAKLPVIAVSMIAIAGAIGVLSGSLLLISTLDWNELARGLSGLGALLAGLSVAVQPLSKAGPGFLIAGAGMSALALGLVILGGAVKIFGSMDWDEMGKGLLGVAAALTAVALASKFISPAILLIGPGLIATGIALAAIGGAVKIFASLSLEEMATGILGMVAALEAIAFAVITIPPTLPLTAAGLILVGIGLTSIAAAVAAMGNMKPETLIQGILGIGAALVVLAAGLTAMSGSIPGTLALLGAATALALLVPVIGIFGKMSWGTLAKAIGGMVLAILALGVAGTVAAPGLVALGLGLLALGAGVYLIASGLVKLGKEGGKGVAVALAAMAAFVAAFPHMVIDFIKGLVEIIGQIAKIAPEVVKSGLQIARALANGLVKGMPHFEKAGLALVRTILKIIRRGVPDLINTALVIILALAEGIEKNIGKLTKSVANIIVNFIKALTDRVPALIKAGVELVVAVLKGIAKNAKKLVKAGADLIVNLIKGVGTLASELVRAGINAAAKFVNAIARGAVRMADEGAKAVIRFLNGVADVLEKRTPEIMRAGFRIGTAVVRGMINGIASIADELWDYAMDLAGGVIDGIKDKLDVFSPSRVMYTIGGNVVQGLINGMRDGAPTAVAVSENLAIAVVSGFTSKLKKLAPPQQRVLNSLGGDLADTFYAPMLGLDQTVHPVDQAFDDMINRIESRADEAAVRLKDARKKADEAWDTASGADFRIGVLQGKLKDKLKDKPAERKQWKQDIEDLKEVRRKANTSYADLTKTIKNEEKLQKLLLSGAEFMGTKFGKARDDLKGLGKDLEDTAKLIEDTEADLEKATQALDDAKQARKDAAEGFRDDFTALPEVIKKDINDVTISSRDQVKNYIETLKKQVEATKKFRQTLEALRAAGLDEATYKKLLAEGIDSQEFAEGILAGGDSAIKEINSLDDRLLDEATDIGDKAAAAFYDKGVKVAQETVDGLVDGLAKLKDRKQDIEAGMKWLADMMLAAIKKKLKIKSPSEVFAEVGKFTVLGMANGLKKASSKVTDAITGVSRDALNAMKSKMRQVSEAVANEIDPNPTIAPILDLSNIQNGSKLIQSMMPGVSATSMLQASVISSEQMSARLAEMAAAQAREQEMIKFEQNNYSPEALSDIEIYRRTKTLLSQARPVLAVPAK